MSIIQEALKKVEKPESRMAEKPQDEKPVKQKFVFSSTTSKATDTKNEPGPRIIYYTIMALLLLLLVGIVIRVSYSSTSAVPAAQPKKIEPILPSIERRIEQPKPRRRQESLGGFVLSGIMQIVDGPRAIINGIMVGEGETVNGAKVEKIKKDKVLLKYNDTEVDLNINE